MDCCWNVFDKVIHAADRSLKITVAQYTSYSGSKAIGDISQFCEGDIFTQKDLKRSGGGDWLKI